MYGNRSVLAAAREIAGKKGYNPDSMCSIGIYSDEKKDDRMLSAVGTTHTTGYNDVI